MNGLLFGMAIAVMAVGLGIVVFALLGEIWQGLVNLSWRLWG